jgi:hypothetical protein
MTLSLYIYEYKYISNNCRYPRLHPSYSQLLTRFYFYTPVISTFHIIKFLLGLFISNVKKRTIEMSIQASFFFFFFFFFFFLGKR